MKLRFEKKYQNCFMGVFYEILSDDKKQPGQ